MISGDGATNVAGNALISTLVTRTRIPQHQCLSVVSQDHVAFVDQLPVEHPRDDWPGLAVSATRQIETLSLDHREVEVGVNDLL